MRITAASPGKVSFELPIEKQHTNRLGILHGATIATMVDTSGSLALASRGLYSTGVSTDPSVTYLNAGGKVGDTIRGEVKCDKCKAHLPSLRSVIDETLLQLGRRWRTLLSPSLTRTMRLWHEVATPNTSRLLGRTRKTVRKN